MNNIKNLVEKKWSGGVTREIYRDQEDFNIRISCAEIYTGESLFSDFTGYKRILKILENDVTIERNSDTKIFLNKDNIFIFDGSDKIKSKNENRVVDFNVIYKPEYYQVSFEEIEGSYYSRGNQHREDTLIFSLCEGFIQKDESDNFNLNNSELKMEKYDFLFLNNLTNYRLNGKFIVVKFH